MYIERYRPTCLPAACSIPLLIYLHKCLPPSIFVSMYIDLPSSIPIGPRIPPPTYLPTYLPANLAVYFYSLLPSYKSTQTATRPATQHKLLNIIYTFLKYFPDGCFVVYRLLFASFSVNSKLLHPFRSLFGPFGPFRFFSVLFGPFRCLGRPWTDLFFEWWMFHDLITHYGRYSMIRYNFGLEFQDRVWNWLAESSTVDFLVGLNHLCLARSWAEVMKIRCRT